MILSCIIKKNFCYLKKILYACTHNNLVGPFSQYVFEQRNTKEGVTTNDRI